MLLINRHFYKALVVLDERTEEITMLQGEIYQTEQSIHNVPKLKLCFY